MASPAHAVQTAIQIFLTLHPSRSWSRGLHEVTKALRRNIASLILVAADVTPANLLDRLRSQAAHKGVPLVTLDTKAMLGALVGISSATTLSLNRGQDYVLHVVNQLEAAAVAAAAAEEAAAAAEEVEAARQNRS